MLDRYAREEMKEIWSDKKRFDTWLEVEKTVVEAWSEYGEVPKEDAQKIRENANYSLKRVYEIEKITRHDVVAFTRAVSESLGDEKKWVHYGLTSTDVVDTSYGCIYKQANDLLYEDLCNLKNTIKEKAKLYKMTPCMGRTHGVHAEITTFGLKMALWYEEISRDIIRFNAARRDVECGKISGAVGTFANCDPFIQDYVCAKLGIESSKISTQVLQRDRHAYYFGVLALIGSSLEKFATEIRHLQRTEVREVEEHFHKGQKGSSAMPHKRNPIGSENICGCSRVLRGYMLTAYENINLWHERDISHSSSERIISQDATCLLDYMLNRFNNILKNLDVFPENMLKNINLTHGVIFSQAFLLALVEKGMSREKAYDLVQPNAMKAWEEGKSFKMIMENIEAVRKLMTQEEIDQCFTFDRHLKNVDKIFTRVGLNDEI